MDHGIHPPDVVVTLSRTNTGIVGGEDPDETTSPLPSAPSSPRGSPTPSPTQSSRSSRSRSRSRSRRNHNDHTIVDDEDLLVPDDERILSSPQQQQQQSAQYPYQYHHSPYQQRSSTVPFVPQPPPPPPSQQPNMSFQDDEEQDEMAHFLHHQQPLPVLNPHPHHFVWLGLGHSTGSLEEEGPDTPAALSSSGARETPFDEEGTMMMMIPIATTTTTKDPPILLEEKKESDKGDHHDLLRQTRPKDWTTISTSSSVDPSLDGQPLPPPPPPQQSLQDNHDEDPVEASSKMHDDNDHDDEDSQPPSLAPLETMEEFHPAPPTTNGPAALNATTVTMMRTPDQQPVKSPPVLFKTSHVEWNLPSPEPDRLVALPRTLSLTPPLTLLDHDEDKDEQEQEPTMDAPPPPTHHRSSMTFADESGGGFDPMTTILSTTPTDDVLRRQRWEDKYGASSADPRLSGMSKEGRYLPKPATLRSISVPVHTYLSMNNDEEDDDNNYDADDEPATSSFVRKWEDPTSPMTLVEERPGRALRSVSDIPRSTSMSDWTKYLVNDDPQVKGITDISQWLDQESSEPRRASFRQMTPKQDFKLSEKSAAWLQEEFKRRSTIKKEINAAILARSDLRKEGHEIIMSGDSFVTETTAPEATSTIVADTTPDESEEAFAAALSNALKALPSSPLSVNVGVAAEFSQHSEDDEVAALTTFNNTLKSLTEGILTIPSEEDDASLPRRLDYGSTNARSLSTAVPTVLSGVPPHATAPQNGTIDFRQDMLRFANETRNVLYGGNHSSKKSDESDPKFRSLAVSADGDVEESSMDVMGVITGGTLHRSTISAITDDGSTSSPFDLSSTPPLVESLDSYLGISKGDITLSLLNEDNTTSAKSTWANRVRVAVWRARRMRRGWGILSSSVVDSARGRPSLPVAIDRARVVGGIRSVQASQESAQFHLMHDEIDEALELFEDIIFAYYGHFERSLKAREADPGAPHEDTDFRSYIGAALHNLGILNLLKGEYNQALSYFGRAVENRKGCLGESHSDHVVRETEECRTNRLFPQCCARQTHPNVYPTLHFIL